MPSLPTYEDILTAQAVVGRFLPHTPTYQSPGLSSLVGCEICVKHENHIPPRDRSKCAVA